MRSGSSALTWYSWEYTTDGKIVMELPVEHGLLLDNLLEPGPRALHPHSSTFAKGWSVPNLVKFLTPASDSKDTGTLTRSTWSSGHLVWS
ncbi:hypothetical protein MLD38_034011 [Melastoma candidum]|uniref:Uncharacterized protein n=1 Tax=Melastoma candidum TaxID=119954 RepID=A0ACB9M8J4_9MYRT|nr:hypothetical protein MLD38_034011 [Melastoma candidum]